MPCCKWHACTSVLWITALVEACLQSVFLIEAKLRKERRKSALFLFWCKLELQSENIAVIGWAGRPAHGMRESFSSVPQWGACSSANPVEIGQKLYIQNNNLLYFPARLCVIVFHNSHRLSCTRDNEYAIVSSPTPHPCDPGIQFQGLSAAHLSHLGSARAERNPSAAGRSLSGWNGTQQTPRRRAKDWDK